MRTEDKAAAAARYQNVITSPIRSDQDRRIDASRHPAEFLAFAQVKPGMKVLDVSAGGGYTSQLLALAVTPSGMLWAQSPKPGPTLLKRLEDHTQADFVIVTEPFEDSLPGRKRKLDVITLVLKYHDITYLPVERA